MNNDKRLLETLSVEDLVASAPPELKRQAEAVQKAFVIKNEMEDMLSYAIPNGDLSEEAVDTVHIALDAIREILDELYTTCPTPRDLIDKFLDVLDVEDEEDECDA